MNREEAARFELAKTILNMCENTIDVYYLQSKLIVYCQYIMEQNEVGNE